MNPYTQLERKIPEIEKVLEYGFRNHDLLLRSFVHRSFLNENKDLQLKHNERLEFLGDAVLNLIVGEYLFHHLPDITEGELSALRAHIVSAASCTQFIQKLNLHTYVLVGKGEKIDMGKRKISILADLFEALLGAIYLDGGLECVRAFFLSHFSPLLQSMLEEPELNFKALLQEHIQKTLHEIPKYEVLSESGPDHEKSFEIGVYVGQKLISKGEGLSKKEAEQSAAKKALKELLPNEG